MKLAIELFHVNLKLQRQFVFIKSCINIFMNTSKKKKKKNRRFINIHFTITITIRVSNFYDINFFKSFIIYFIL